MDDAQRLDEQVHRPLLEAAGKQDFLDTNGSSHCGVVRIVNNGLVRLPFSALSNETHFINARLPPNKGKNPKCEILLILTGHWGHYFQHFFDNIGPQLSMAIDALGVDPRNITLVADISSMFPNVPKLWKRIGFKRVVASKINKNYAAKTLVYVESAPKVHPHYFENIRKLLKIPESDPAKRKKIIFVSRKMSNSYYNQRFILNEDNVIYLLQMMYGKKHVVIYDHHNYTLDETIELFSEARAIIGAHGGGLYNQFFSPKTAVVIEILPIKKNGLYPDQKNPEKVPSFSHMAVWSNTQLIGQKFYRFYQITYQPNFMVDLYKFEKFLAKIPELKDEEL
ncbi:hypothetical protein TRFO_08736 [Tritrichomonas foetus]|uniref:Glycosyltransferase 61 catalytic domain-containing protein n=1 Tax=Tritrichomonas foetus TaxID=1144522 RepID=A0A1J4JMD5_9EUKA|nr:hypothetical protein TRFO_08736 [Tritrichomonas foetus]|eukprot:OHS98731.1 hypothetical protein TRFO_08736 [Tritrichomonas foetus]